MTIEELNAKGYLEDVLFDYDKAELTEGARTSLQKNADWLRKWTSTRITVEGHADERGTNEYNLALGERRAAAVRDYLVSLGVPATRMNIVSKGEEEPACREETEGCWVEEPPRALRHHGEELVPRPATRAALRTSGGSGREPPRLRRGDLGRDPLRGLARIRRRRDRPADDQIGTAGGHAAAGVSVRC